MKSITSLALRRITFSENLNPSEKIFLIKFLMIFGRSVRRTTNDEIAQEFGLNRHTTRLIVYGLQKKGILTPNHLGRYGIGYKYNKDAI
jgi:predicted DNA-binding transcriptional regulator